MILIYKVTSYKASPAGDDEFHGLISQFYFLINLITIYLFKNIF